MMEDEKHGQPCLGGGCGCNRQSKLCVARTVPPTAIIVPIFVIRWATCSSPSTRSVQLMPSLMEKVMQGSFNLQEELLIIIGRSFLVLCVPGLL